MWCETLDVEAERTANRRASAGPPGGAEPDALAFCYAPTLWPERPAGFVEAWKADLAARVMRVFAAALGLAENHFAPFIDAPTSALRALNDPEQRVAPKAGPLRAGAHTDYGSLTIMLPQPGSQGLEMMTPGGAWLPVPPVPGAFVVNIGDLMARWTDDRWVSTLRRVVNPPADAGRGDRRQSLAFFHQPNWDAEIVGLDACLAPGTRPKYEPVRSGPYPMGKFKAMAVPNPA